MGAIADRSFREFQLFLQKDPEHDKTAEFYIHRATGLRRRDMGRSGFEDRPSVRVMDPFVFLTRETGEITYNHYQDQAEASYPYMALLVGQYGTGKTEISYRLCEFVRSLGESGRVPHPLPISLSSCRERRNWLDQEPDGLSFARLLFENLLSKAAGPDAMRREEDLLRGLRREIYQGNILLVLDALDELADGQTRHANFFRGLRNWLDWDAEPESRSPRFRILVTMRREHLATVNDLAGTTMLTEFTAGRFQSNAYMMELGQFSESEIESYFERRLDRHPNLCDEVKKRDSLLATLHRPLLIKIFGDLVEQPRPDKDIESLLKIGAAPAELLKEYVEAARNFAYNEQKELKATHIWNNDMLASECVKLYSRGSDQLEEKNIENIREKMADGPGPTDGEKPLLSIYKCPFLLRVGDTSARFAHRAFLEYFTARGVVKSAEDNFDESEEFNELVLNSDMRKFLSYMVNHSDEIGKRCIKELQESEFDPSIRLFFHIITRRSYGLLDEQEWPMGKTKFREQQRKLDAIRITLLDAMTEPEKEKDEVLRDIKEFLDREDSDLHPKYLMYCHEGVAAYLAEHPSPGGSRELSDHFSEILRKRLEKVTDDLRDPEFRESRDFLVEPSQLLAERIIDIALRMRYSWVCEYAEKDRQKEWFVGEWNEDSRTRLENILKGISQAKF